MTTEDERVALYHLAKEGLVHPTNPALPGLLKRKLVEKKGNLRLMNKEFLDFVGEAIDQETLGSYEKVAAENPWQRFQRPLQAALLIVILVLFLTQREMMQGFFGILTGAAGVLTLLARLFTRPAAESEDKS